MKVLLDNLLPRLFPTLSSLCVAHEGKSDLERSLPRKLRAWNTPDDQFVVIRDSDGSNCLSVKTALVQQCVKAGRPETLVRIACRELEAWYFGEPAALATAFNDDSLSNLGTRARYRHSDLIVTPSQALRLLCPDFQKVSGARRMASHLTYVGNRSPSFRALIEGIARVADIPLPG